MKSTFLTLLISFLVASVSIAQNQIIVDNNTNGIGQFTDLSDAIAAAGTGDIILVIPSAQTYESAGLTIAKSDITIAGGGGNGQLGEYTLIGPITVSAGQKNITLGGFRSGNFTVIGGAARIRNLNIQAVYVNGDMTISSVDTLKLGYVRAVNLTVNSSTEFVAYHNMLQTEASIMAINTTNNFIFSNSLFEGGQINVDANSVGLFNNNSVITSYNATTILNFGPTVNVTNNIFSHQPPNSGRSLSISGGGVFQFNVLHNWFNSYNFAASTMGTVTDVQSGNTNSNFTTTNRDFINRTTFDLIESSLAKDIGTGLDADGTTADLGASGGLNPMPADIPSVGKGISVVPSITSIQLSLPNPASGGSVILNVTGQSKRN